jgi:hypothetical protein
MAMLSERDKKIGAIFRVEIMVAGKWKPFRQELVFASEAIAIMARMSEQERMCRIVVPQEKRIDSTNHAEISKLLADRLGKDYMQPVT